MGNLNEKEVERQDRWDGLVARYRSRMPSRDFSEREDARILLDLLDLINERLNEDVAPHQHRECNAGPAVGTYDEFLK